MLSKGEGDKIDNFQKVVETRLQCIWHQCEIVTSRKRPNYSSFPLNVLLCLIQSSKVMQVYSTKGMGGGEGENKAKSFCKSFCEIEISEDA